MVSSPRFSRMFARALLRRCPWCGDRSAWIRRWVAQVETCRRCGLVATRDTPGHELGSSVVNLTMVIGALAVALPVTIVATRPGVSLVALYIVLGTVGVAGPVVFLPFSRTLWMAIDLATRPPTEKDFRDT